MAYDANRNYAEEIRRAIASGASGETVAQLNQARNEKIAANQAHYDALGVSADDAYGTAAREYLRRKEMETETAAQTAARPAESGTTAVPAAAPAADTGILRASLKEWLEAAQGQAAARTDRATAQAVQELTQANADAQVQYQVQQNQISAEEARAKDNQALYAAARGDRGGIGAAQYDSVQNTAAVQRAALSAARTRMAEETARQIAQLRAQGEYDKADAALQLTQQYLTQLMSLQRWAAEYQLDAARFQSQLDQWQANYDLKRRQMDLDQEQWQASYDLNLQKFDWSRQTDQRDYAYQLARDAAEDSQWERTFAQNQRRYEDSRADTQRQQALSERQQLLREAQQALQERQYADTQAERTRQRRAEYGRLLLDQGLLPDGETLALMGLKRSDAERYLSAVRSTQK